MDELELCKLWNQVQSLSASVEALIALVNILIGGRVKRALTTPASYSAMSTLEQDIIVALIDGYEAIYPCCSSPIRDCNEVEIQSVADRVGLLHTQFRAMTNLTQAFTDSYFVYEKKIGELGDCAAYSTALLTSPTTTTLVPTTTSSPATTTAANTCCPEFILQPDICDLLCLLYGSARYKRGIPAAEIPAGTIGLMASNSSIIYKMKSVYVYLDSHMNCFQGNI